MIRGPAVDTRNRLVPRFRSLRALALALALPGLLLSGAVNLRVCLGEWLAPGEGCVALVETGCCDLPAEAPSVADTPDCGGCCIAIDVSNEVPIAPLPESGTGTQATPALPAPVLGSLAPVATALGTPAHPTPRLARPPGRAPTPLRI